METGFPDKWAVSSTEMGIKSIIYAKNCLIKRAHKAECTYVIHS